MVSPLLTPPKVTVALERGLVSQKRFSVNKIFLHLDKAAEPPLGNQASSWLADRSDEWLRNNSCH
jgi:hypothetical protein